MAPSAQTPTGRKQQNRKRAVRKKVPKRKTAGSKAKSRAPRKKKLSRQRKPDEMSLEAWQQELRRQYGREQNFELTNIGAEQFFSEFHVTNPESENTYRVAIPGQRPVERNSRSSSTCHAKATRPGGSRELLILWECTTVRIDARRRID